MNLIIFGACLEVSHHKARATIFRMRGLGAIITSAALVALSVSPARAQQAETIGLEKPSLDQILSSSACLQVAENEGFDEVKRQVKKGRSIAIAVPAKKVDEFLKRGFSKTECTGLNLIDQATKRDFCAIADANDPALNFRFWQRFSFTAEEGCKLIDAFKAF
jgi:hypothetical protein